jgi:hypothetical protein
MAGLRPDLVVGHAKHTGMTQPWLGVGSLNLFLSLSSNLLYLVVGYFCTLFMFLFMCQLILIGGCKNEVLRLILIQVILFVKILHKKKKKKSVNPYPICIIIVDSYLFVPLKY